MEHVFYLTSNYEIVENKERTSFKVILTTKHAFKSVSINSVGLDSIAFNYKVEVFSGWYECNDLPDENDEDNDFFICDKWSGRAPYFYFSEMDSDYGLGEEVIHQANIYKVIQNLFIK